MTSFHDLSQANIEDDLTRRREFLQKLSDKELVSAVNSPLNDVRNVKVAKQLLKERGVSGVPE